MEFNKKQQKFLKHANTLADGAKRNAMSHIMVRLICAYSDDVATIVARQRTGRGKVADARYRRRHWSKYGLETAPQSNADAEKAEVEKTESPAMRAADFFADLVNEPRPRKPKPPKDKDAGEQIDIEDEVTVDPDKVYPKKKAAKKAAVEGVDYELERVEGGFRIKYLTPDPVDETDDDESSDEKPAHTSYEDLEF